MTGEKLEMGFNNKFLLDALRVCDTDEVIIKAFKPRSSHNYSSDGRRQFPLLNFTGKA